jgi:hypothetical protein
MRKSILVLIFAGFLTGCSSEPATTQYECLQQGKFKYNDRCVEYGSIPTEDQLEVWDEVATEIAIIQGVSKDEALLMILEQIEGE